MAEVPNWQLTGDWFDVCRCRVPCGCTFAQAPDEEQCDGILAWHIREGSYGDVKLDGLTVVMVGSFEGNVWTGEANNSVAGFFIDERADESQREALQAIWTGQALRIRSHVSASERRTWLGSTTTRQSPAPPCVKVALAAKTGAREVEARAVERGRLGPKTTITRFVLVASRNG